MTSFYKILALGVAVGFLALVSKPRAGCRKDARRTEALNNARHLHLALMDFESRYGRFPDEETMQRLAGEKGFEPFPLRNSNDYLRQLVAAGVRSEKPGYCPHKALPSRKPDDVIAPLGEAFAPGECGFAYIAGLSSGDALHTPLLVAPMIPGTYRFDRKTFDGKAIVLSLDGLAKAMTIRENDGLVAIGGGRTLFDADLPHWRGKVPQIKYPAPPRP